MIKNSVILIFGIFLLTYRESGGAQFLGLVLIMWSGWCLLRIFTSTSGALTNEISAKFSNFKYKHIHEKTGIAIDTDKQEVHLKVDDHYKVYKYNEIRTWESSLSTGGQVYGKGLSVIAANVSTARQNANSTGLFIKVKDIDFPEWKISFPLKSAKNDMNRWMEILSQTVNESAS
jgi:Domain of unknown function (DUF4755)